MLPNAVLPLEKSLCLVLVVTEFVGFTFRFSRLLPHSCWNTDGLGLETDRRRGSCWFGVRSYTLLLSGRESVTCPLKNRTKGITVELSASPSG